MRPSYRLVSDVFEESDAYPVVTHIFYGNNKQQVKNLYLAHLKSDAFLRACKTTKKFSNFRCKEQHSIEYWNDTGWNPL